MRINKALLQKSYKVTVPAGKTSHRAPADAKTSAPADAQVSAPAYNQELIPEVSQLFVFCAEHGFGLSEDLVKAFFKMEKPAFEKIARELVEDLSEMTFDIMYDAETFYKNFPADPLTLSPAERYGYQVAYYLFGDVVRDYLPEKQKDPINLTSLRSNARMLTLGSEEDVLNLYRRMMASPVSLSLQDREYLQEEFKKKNRIMLSVIPEKMPNKENMTFVSGRVLEAFPEVFMEKCGGKFTTVTDVLRLIAVLNGNSAALSEEKWEVKAMSRKRRRIVFSLLDKCGNFEEDMKRNIGKWKSVAFRYHPFEFVKNPSCREAFDHLYKDDLEKTFNAKVEEAVTHQELDRALDLLTSRPGEFARRLDALLCAFTRQAAVVLKRFEAVPAEKFEPKLLLQLMAHFNARTQMKEVSLYLPKGGEAGVFAKADDRLPISEYTYDRIRKICEDKLLKIYEKKPALQKVYIDESVKGYKIPMQQRNNSKAGLRVPAKGSRIKSDPDKDIVRTFIWWTNEENGTRVDVDLSLNMYDEHMTRTGTYFYGNFFSGTGEDKVSSGDLTDGGPFGGKGAAEYLDFSRSKMLEQGHRYIQVCVNSFTGNNFDRFPCKFGFMQRDSLKQEAPFEPSTLESNIDISVDTTNYSPVVYDTKTGDFIWVDVTGLGKNGKIINTLGQATSFNAALYMATHNEIPELYDLIRINALARGEIVENKEEADVIYSLKEGITPYDMDIISADLLSREVAEEITLPEKPLSEESLPEESLSEESLPEEGEVSENKDMSGAVHQEKGEHHEQPEQLPVDRDFLLFLIRSLF